MKLTRRLLLSSVFSAALGLGLGMAVPASAHEKLKVVTSFSILGDMTARIGGDRVEVTSLVGPDGDAHVYQPSPADARALAGAGLVIVNGLDFEGWLPRLIEASGYRGTVITASAGVRVIESRDGHRHDDHDHDHDDKDHGHDHGHAHGETDQGHDHGHAHGEKDHGHDHGNAHGEKDHGHDHGHAHGEKDHGHDHGHAHGERDHGHDHGHAHGEKDHGHDHGHAHGEKDHDHDHGHAHGEKDHGHDHGHDHAHGPEDPHAWLDLTSAGIYVDNITAALANADPEGTDIFRANAAALRAEMAMLEAEIRAWLATLPIEDRPLIIVPHDAFAYFGRAYGFEFVSPVGTSTESEASARDVAGLVRRIRGGEAALIFGENISDTRLVEQIAREVGLEVSGVLYSGALSPAGGPAPDYVALMRFNFEALKAAVAR